MEFQISVFTKPGEVLVLLYHKDCQKVDSLLEKLQKYENVTVLPIPCSTEGQFVQFLLEDVSPSGDSVKVYPQVHPQEVKRIKPGSPIPLTFKISSQEEGDFEFQLLVKDGETTIKQHPFEVKCTGSKARRSGDVSRAALVNLKGGTSRDMTVNAENAKVVANRGRPGSEGHQHDATATAALLNADESTLSNVQVNATGASVTANQGNISQTPKQQTSGSEKNIGMTITGTVDSVIVAGGEYKIGGSHQYNSQDVPNPQQNEAGTTQGPQYNLNVDNRETNIAGKMATHGGTLTTGEHGTSNPMNVKT